MFNKIFPHPILTLMLWITWLLLNNTFAAGHIALGFILATLIPWFTASFWPEKVSIKHPLILFKFIGVVLWDILVSNMIVAKLILGDNRKLKPSFFSIELDINTPLSISLLANTISLTPGTVSCDLNKDRTRLLVHALDVDDIEETIKFIKTRYETPLKKVFTS